jgi:large subunit ribosomal protein L29
VARVRELRDLGEDDLVQRLDASKEELFNLRFQLATGQLDNPMRITEVRREVARILTILRERELEIEQPIQPEPARVTRARQRASERASAPDATPVDEGAPEETEAAAEAPTKRRRLRRQREES